MALPEIIQKLLEHGVHFGHLSKHWNPKMKRFIFGKKKNIYIIDLEKTVKSLERAKEFVREVAKRGGKILFVGTKKQLQDTIKELASSCQMPYVIERWVGGFLTNFVTIKERVRRYVELKEKREKGKILLDNFRKIPANEIRRKPFRRAFPGSGRRWFQRPSGNWRRCCRGCCPGRRCQGGFSPGAGDRPARPVQPPGRRLERNQEGRRRCAKGASWKRSRS